VPGARYQNRHLAVRDALNSIFADHSHTKVRYRGIRKNLAQMYTLFALANVYRVRQGS